MRMLTYGFSVSDDGGHQQAVVGISGRRRLRSGEHLHAVTVLDGRGNSQSTDAVLAHHDAAFRRRMRLLKEKLAMTMGASLRRDGGWSCKSAGPRVRRRRCRCLVEKTCSP